MDPENEIIEEVIDIVDDDSDAGNDDDGGQTDETNDGAVVEVVEASESHPADIEPEETPLITKLRRELRLKDKQLRSFSADQPKKGGFDERYLDGFDADKEMESAGFDTKKFLSSFLAHSNKKQDAAIQQQTFEQKARRYIQEKMGNQALIAAESVVCDFLSNAHQQAIIDNADNPSAVVMTLAKDQKLLDKLAEAKTTADAIRVIGQAEMKAELMKKPVQNKPAPEAGLQRTSSAGAAPKNIDAAVQKAQQNGNYDAALAAIRAERLRAKKK